MSNLNSESIPIIFFHISSPEYLHKVINQAKSTNERVVLLGDDSSKAIGAEHHHIDDYNSDMEPFYSCYKHMSTNNEHFEKICFIRWFVIRNFMRKNNIQACFYADSDIMIYSNLSDEWNKYKNFFCSFMEPEEQKDFRWSASGHNSYWTLTAIEEFCDFLNNCYSTDSGLAKLSEKWNFHRSNNKPGGICDMTLLWLFLSHKNRQNIGILSEVAEDESTFDDNISDSGNRFRQEYRMTKDGSMKDIQFRNGQPFCFNLILNKWVRFNTLHFSGPKKSLIGVLEN